MIAPHSIYLYNKIVITERLTHYHWIVQSRGYIDSVKKRAQNSSLTILCCVDWFANGRYNSLPLRKVLLCAPASSVSDFEALVSELGVSWECEPMLSTMSDLKSSDLGAKLADALEKANANQTGSVAFKSYTSTVSLQHCQLNTLSLQHSDFNNLTSTMSLHHSLTSTLSHFDSLTSTLWIQQVPSHSLAWILLPCPTRKWSPHVLMRWMGRRSSSLQKTEVTLSWPCHKTAPGIEHNLGPHNFTLSVCLSRSGGREFDPQSSQKHFSFFGNSSYPLYHSDIHATITFESSTAQLLETSHVDA